MCAQATGKFFFFLNAFVSPFSPISQRSANFGHNFHIYIYTIDNADARPDSVCTQAMFDTTRLGYAS